MLLQAAQVQESVTQSRWALWKPLVLALAAAQRIEAEATKVAEGRKADKEASERTIARWPALREGLPALLEQERQKEEELRAAKSAETRAAKETEDAVAVAEAGVAKEKAAKKEVEDRSAAVTREKSSM